ncbi:MAG: hypothetical protein LAT55_13015 [Opitutales bacterium]|nr:hypothetical protein [Opitutales bacterium]
MTKFEVQRADIAPTDLYHADHPLHHLGLDEEEEMRRAAQDYDSEAEAGWYRRMISDA